MGRGMDVASSMITPCWDSYLVQQRHSPRVVVEIEPRATCPARRCESRGSTCRQLDRPDVVNLSMSWLLSSDAR